MHITNTGFAAILLCLASVGSTAAAEPRDAPSSIDTIVLWLAANFGLPASAEHPTLITVPATELAAMRYGPGATVSPGEVMAVYDDTDHTIYLVEGWTGRTPAELSVLVHEMVHHLQSTADMRFACAGEREKLAYQAQDAWLGLFGDDLESAFGIHDMTLLVGTVCTH